MRVKQVTCRRSVLINLGDYQNITLSVEMEAELDEFDDPDSCTRELGYQVDAALCRQIGGSLVARGKKVSAADVCRQYGLKLKPKAS